MSYASTSGSTGQGDEGPSAGDRTTQWEGLVDEFSEWGHQVLGRVSDRARHNIGLAREGNYGLDEWLDDVKWFWQGVAEDTARLVEAVQNQGTRS